MKYTELIVIGDVMVFMIVLEVTKLGVEVNHVVSAA
jgi:hypothetical protein